MTEHICNKCGQIVREETNPEMAKAYPWYCPNCDENLYGIETSEVDTVYIASVTTKHYDIYEQDDDGEVILGVYSTLDAAYKRILDEYNKDITEFLAGSCKPDGNCIIDDEWNSPPHKDDANGLADAYIGIRYKGAEGLDRAYSYDVRRHIVQE